MRKPGSDGLDNSISGHRFRRIRALAGIALLLILSGCAGLPENSGRTSSYVIDDTIQTRLGSLYDAKIEANPGLSGVVLLRHGPDALSGRVASARLAERSIDVQYYIWQQDIVGHLLLRELLDAADRGVRVRILLDDMYSDDKQDPWRALHSHPHMEVRLFNPFSRSEPRFWQFLTNLKDVNYRMHSKSFTVDNKMAIIGGRNIGDEYFEASSDLVYADRDVLFIGPAVAEVSDEFDEYWNSDHAYPVSTLVSPEAAVDLDTVRGELDSLMTDPDTRRFVEEVRERELAGEMVNGTIGFVWGPGRIIHDTSEKREYHDNAQPDLLISQLAPYITSATEEVIIISPYFVPGERATKALCKLSEEDVLVRILTNSLASNDVPAVHAGYAKYRRPLLRCGVEVYEMNASLTERLKREFVWLPDLKRTGLHAKGMTFDKAISFVGSFNFDQRSLHINNEIGLLFEEKEFTQPLSEEFDRNIDQFAFKVALFREEDGRETLRWHGVEEGEAVTYRSEPHAALGTRFVVWLLKLFPIESQL